MGSEGNVIVVSNPNTTERSDPAVDGGASAAGDEDGDPDEVASNVEDTAAAAEDALSEQRSFYTDNQIYKFKQMAQKQKVRNI